LPVFFIGEYGLDEVGSLIDRFLKENNVSTQYVYRYYDGKSSLALAFLNENNDASYDFYKFYPENRLNIEFPEIQPNDIVLFGSIYAITPEVRSKLLGFIRQARKKKAIVIYDPNFRKQHLCDLQRLLPMIMENFSLANIVRGSNEDFSFILGVTTADEAYEQIGGKTPNLLFTDNTRGVSVRTPSLQMQFPVRSIQPISTIGAGDNFNAGVVYSIYKLGIGYDDLNNLGENAWAEIAGTAVDFATQVCLSYDNYISREFAESYKK
jgi:fructokinase